MPLGGIVGSGYGSGGTGGVTTGITEADALALIADWAETGQARPGGWVFGVC